MAFYLNKKDAKTWNDFTKGGVYSAYLEVLNMARMVLTKYKI